MDDLERILEISIKRNGEKPLTTSYLLNLIRLAQKRKEFRENVHEKTIQQAYEEAVGEDLKWGSD